jgi:hypothetical protein
LLEALQGSVTVIKRTVTHAPLRAMNARIRRDVEPVDFGQPAAYWESRARDLIDGYDHPDTWGRRGWMRGGIEERVVPDLLRREKVATVLIPGAGTGRQYAFLLAEGFEPRGFDLSPTLVQTCQDRFPSVETVVGSVIDAADHQQPSDAVAATAVLQHVPPGEIAQAVSALKSLARKVIVVRELTRLDAESRYQFAHDYSQLFADWTEIERLVTDDRDGVRVELIAWRRP